MWTPFNRPSPRIVDLRRKVEIACPHGATIEKIGGHWVISHPQGALKFLPRMTLLDTRLASGDTFDDLFVWLGTIHWTMQAGDAPVLSLIGEEGQTVPTEGDIFG